jgi:hypothetical protein
MYFVYTSILCIVTELLLFFLIIVPDGYSIPTRNPTGMGIKFYPQVWVWV